MTAHGILHEVFLISVHYYFVKYSLMFLMLWNFPMRESCLSCQYIYFRCLVNFMTLYPHLQLCTSIFRRKIKCVNMLIVYNCSVCTMINASTRWWTTLLMSWTLTVLRTAQRIIRAQFFSCCWWTSEVTMKSVNRTLTSWSV